VSPHDSVPALKWPRSLEGHPRLGELEAKLEAAREPLWERGEIEVARIGATPALRDLIASLQGRNQIERGLENIAAILASEKKGQGALHAKQGTSPAFRVSRILLINDQGSERFYRDCERLLRDHAERVLGLRLDESGAALFGEVFGEAATVKAVLVSHKEAVAQTLLALLDAHATGDA